MIKNDFTEAEDRIKAEDKIKTEKIVTLMMEDRSVAIFVLKIFCFKNENRNL